MPSPIARAISRIRSFGRAGLVIIPGLILGSGFGATGGAAFGHGAFLDATVVPAVEVHARYDTGEPMVAAQVTIFAPDDPARPWMVGVTDSRGRYSFIPDAQPGRWAIQARQAGHGAMGYVEWRADPSGDPVLPVTVMVGRTDGQDMLQRLLMGASVVWGCIGTALYFRRTRRRDERHRDERRRDEP